LTQDTVKLQPKDNNVPVKYLYWLLRTPQYRGYCRAHATGTTNLGLSRDDFFAFPAPEPTPIQHRIVHVLDALDDKIELNRRMNETLEGMARALFTSWFVDFEPVRAKLRGQQPEGMDAATAALFPSSIEDSALGEIPKGWELRTLGQVVELAYGKGLREEDRVAGNIPVYGSNGPVGYHAQALTHGPGIVIGRKGTAGTVTLIHSDFFPIDTTFYVIPRTRTRCAYFLYHLLAQQNLVSDVGDSAVPGLNRNVVYAKQVVIPNESVVCRFSAIVSDLYHRIEATNSESKTLTTLRDILLPKLMSGEARVKGVEKIAES
jgi:type I restriction enzyme S subunit